MAVKAVQLLLGCAIILLVQSLRTEEQEKWSIPEKIFAGEIHYSRIPVEYWEHRIKMIKALGLNTLSVYIMWNHHQVERGVFDYSNDNKNLPYFLELAEKYQMKVLFRPGPYVCAQWDFGGLPARLLGIEGLNIRAHDYLFLEQVKIYFESLLPIIRKHQCSGSNSPCSIILLQIQNQYGFFASDITYIQDIRALWELYKVRIPQYYVEGFNHIKESYWEGANVGINNGIQQRYYDYVKTFANGLIFGGEIYTGWLTHWSEQGWGNKNISKLEKDYSFLMSNNHSYSMYMVHGGTNFGLTAGANTAGKNYNFRGHVTSYDYIAPINEQGRPTEKYHMLRNMIQQYVSWSIPQIPDPIPAMNLSRFRMYYIASLNQNLGLPVISKSEHIYPFESPQLKMFNQGIVVYETYLLKGQYIFEAVVHDYAIVQLDGANIQTLNRSVSEIHKVRAKCNHEICILKVIVEAFGHINFDVTMKNDYKGLIEFKQINPDFKLLWNYYPINISNPQKIFSWKHGIRKRQGPALLKGTFTLDREPADTYIDMSRLKKGYLWVNGHNLGRYWSIGPQYELFCPGVWLRRGQNIVYVLEMEYKHEKSELKGNEKLTIKKLIDF